MKFVRRALQQHFVYSSLLCLALVRSGPAFAADMLQWRAKENRVEARIESWELPKLLQQVAAATGWQVYLEPGTHRRIEAKFKDLSVGDALRHLLGDLNFALLPQTNAPSKLFVFQNSLQDATQQILPPPAEKKSGKPIPNELVVTLKPDSKESIETFAKRLGAKVTGRIAGSKAYRLQFDDEAATQAARDQLASDSEVSAIDLNYPVENPTRLDGLALSSQPPFALNPPLNGDKSRVIVGLIDTPVQSQASGFGNYFLQSLQVAGDSGAAGDSPTHGTAMAETILHGVSIAQKEGLGQNVRILPVDVYGPNPSTTTFDVAGGIVAAINAGATVINLSLGGDGDTPFLHQLIQQAHAQGILFIGAAGNDPVTTPFYPAAYPEVIAVTAGDKQGNVAPYANRGAFVDVLAPGTSVINFADQSYLVSGTSASTAYITGLAAGLASGSAKPLSEIEARVRAGMAVTPPVPSPKSP
ncbi:MAG: S8 family serine peptidase [Verrucomicrobia bacterium]|nr:S8 family serine peptidase [Verrucomicrobiota bacterium]